MGREIGAQNPESREQRAGPAYQRGVTVRTCHLLNDSPLAGARLARFAVGLLLAFAALVASPPAQAQTPLAPTSQAELDDLLVGKRMLITFPGDSGVSYIDFISPGRTIGDDGEPGSYTYEKTDPNTGNVTLIFVVEDDFSFLVCLIFDSRTTGKVFQCDDPESSVGSWQLVDIPADAYKIITTFAGRPVFVDGGPAVAAELYNPRSVAVDSAGNFYIADASNHRIHKVDSTGTITTIAGTAGLGFRGDGGPAVEAELYRPHGVAVDSAGNFYIADTGNHRIRKVDSTGTITTIAGSRARGFGGDEGPATTARLAFPYGVAVDSAGNLYIADTGNHRIRKVDSTGTITTVAGTGEFGFRGDGGLAVAAELYNPRMAWRWTARATFISPMPVTTASARWIPRGRSPRWRGRENSASGGTGVRQSRRRSTTPVAWRWTARATSISPIPVTTASARWIRQGRSPRWRGREGDSASVGTGIRQSWWRSTTPHGVAVDSAGSLYIADNSNHRIRKVDSTGTITTVAGSGARGFRGDGGPATAARLAFPSGVAVDSAGNFYIADASNHRIHKVDSTGTITTIAGTARARLQVGTGVRQSRRSSTGPYGVAVDSAGNFYIADTGNHRIRKVDSTGTITTIAGSRARGFGGDEGPATTARLAFPYGVAVDSAGNLYIADTGNHRIRKVDSTGTITTVAGTGARFGFRWGRGSGGRGGALQPL